MPAALKTLSRVRATNDAKHLMRYLKSKAGTSPADIAKAEGVSLKTIQESIKSMEQFESRNSEGQLQLHARDMVISVMPQVKETITGLLTATTIMRVKNKKTGLEEDIVVEDKTTRLEAVKLMPGLIAATQPKVPQIQQNITQTNQTAVLSSAETTEERMRRLREKAAEHNLLPPVTAAVPPHIDAGLSKDDYDEDGEDEEDQ